MGVGGWSEKGSVEVGGVFVCVPNSRFPAARTQLWLFWGGEGGWWRPAHYATALC